MAGHSEQDAFCTSLDQIDEAARLGFDSVWLGGIHFQQGRSVPPATASAERPSLTGRFPSPLLVGSYEQQAIYGTPEEVMAKMRWLQAETGCNNLLCWMNAGSRLSQEQVLRSMRLFATEVMPAFPRN